MRDLRPEQINTAARALVQRLGCYDAAAETINAALGTSRVKGTISQRMNGGADWPVIDVMALENALGAFPVTNMLHRRLDGVDEVVNIPLHMLCGAAAKEAGEAVAAALAILGEDKPRTRAVAVKEIDEGIEALQQARAAIVGGGK